jgi:hypothetical protein
MGGIGSGAEQTFPRRHLVEHQERLDVRQVLGKGNGGSLAGRDKVEVGGSGITLNAVIRDRAMKAFGYTRVSTQMQAEDGNGLDVQRRQIEGYALMHGFELAEVVVEEGVSGSVPIAERPAGGRLFAKLKKGDVVIAPKLDRLFRSALDALQVVEDLKKRGVSLHLLDLGGDVSGNGVSKEDLGAHA